MTDAQKEACKAHWDKVRAGLHTPERHVFGVDAKSSISGHRHRAARLIEQASRHAEIANTLAKMDMKL